MYYISITGLKPKGLFSFFRFWRLAIPSFEQARKANAFHRIATGRTFGYESDIIPTWNEAFELLQEKGKNY